MPRTLMVLALATLLTLGGTTAFAATPTPPTTKGPAGASEFIPIAPIPSGKGGEFATTGDLSTYINSVFSLAIAAGAALAALYIAIGGFEYIFSEAMESKKNGRLRIIHALSGLTILLIMTMILYIINPQLVSLSLLSGGGAP